MRLIARTTVVATAASIAVLGVLGGAAHAATGTFVYLTEAGQRMLVDPAAGCHNLPEPLVAAANATDAVATVYIGQDCQGPVSTLPPGAQLITFPLASVSFSS